MAAAEQLGSDKAAVRLAGLYALERLGQDNPKLRQTVFEVWCAYLRMPYTPPVEILRRNARVSPEFAPPGAEPSDPAVEAERRQELEVRLTAQRLLGAHLSLDLAEAAMSTYWFTNQGNRLIIDLVGAVLVDFNLGACEVGLANFNGAQFHGYAYLRRSQFCDEVGLRDVRFHGEAILGEAKFYGRAVLSGAQFYGEAVLGEVQFYGEASLFGVVFHSDAYLRETQFHQNADLRQTRFQKGANLIETKFYGNTYLHETQFIGNLDMTGTLATPRASLPDGWLLSAAMTENDQLRLVARDDGVSSERHETDAAI